MASDLHTHTNYSDGFFSPEVLAAKAKQLGFKYLAITDHDTVDGVKHLKSIGGMDFVQGIKIIRRTSGRWLRSSYRWFEFRHHEQKTAGQAGRTF